MDWKEIHEKALSLTADFKRSESALLEILIAADSHRIFEHFGLTSTFSYCVSLLKLTEDQAYAFIRVARKSVEVPALKTAIVEGALTVSRAKKIASVLTRQNQESWIEKAKILPTRELEREVAKESPQAVLPDRVKPVADELYELRCSLSLEAKRLLARAQDLVAQKQGKPAGVGEVLSQALQEFCDRHDPVRKAERQKNRLRAVPPPVSVLRNGVRTSIPAEVAHGVNLRDEGRCTYVHAEFGRCYQRRWVQLHHVRPVAHGGTHSLENLTTLCAGHHRQLHRSEAR